MSKDATNMNNTIFSINEWDPLKSVVVGSATCANKPAGCHFEQPGPVEQEVINLANRDLDFFAHILKDLGVTVYRPIDNDFVDTKGYYNYCPRDRLLIVGDTVIDCNMQYDCREQEIKFLPMVTENAKRIIKVPRQDDLRFDAANVLRVNDTLLYLESVSGTPKGAEWLQEQFPNLTVETTRTYGGVHIDSTFTPVCDGLVVVNKDRVDPMSLPKCFSGWDVIWLGNEDLVTKQYQTESMASNYIQLNFFMVRPDCAILDNTPKLVKELVDRGIYVVVVPFSQSRTLGGGHHCVTLDLHRSKE